MVFSALTKSYLAFERDIVSIIKQPDCYITRKVQNILSKQETLHLSVDL